MESINKTFNGKCPYCYSKDLEYDIIELVDEEIRQKVSCNKCEKSFSIWTVCNWEYGDNDGIYL